MKKYHHQRNFGPSLSENFSSDVIHSILSSPTDTLQALNESDLNANIQNTTQSAKNKLKKFFNGDYSINYNGTLLSTGKCKISDLLEENLARGSKIEFLRVFCGILRVYRLQQS